MKKLAMRMSAGVIGVSLMCGAAVAAEADIVTEAEVRAAEAEAKALQKQVADVRENVRRLEGRREALSVTADLIAGRRDTPPVKKLVATPVLNLCAEPVTLDNRADGTSQIWKQWLKIEGGKTYRVSMKLAIDEITGTKNFKFGMMVQAPGKETSWPDAFVGGQPFAEKEISFDYFAPQDSGNLLLVGFESGTGVATFRDVRVSELERK